MAALCFLGVVIGSASLAWACVPQPLISVHPMSSGPPGAQVQVNALTINGDAEIRWNAPNGPLLAKASGPAFSVPITIPDVPRGLYSLLVIERQPGGGLGSTGTTAFEVTASGDASSSESTAAVQPTAGLTTNLASPESSLRATPVWLLAIAGLGLLALGVSCGLLLSRRSLPSLLGRKRSGEP